jgi:hypothetical protein
MERREFLIAGMALSALSPKLTLAQAAKPQPQWAMNSTIIEACSCTMFCPCYFSTVPSGHKHEGSMAVDHYCKFNMAHKVNKGNFGDLRLDGAKFWIAGDLGADFSKGAAWAELSFDPAVTKAQRDAITTIVPNLYPLEWQAFTMGKDAPISWQATRDRAEAKLDAGKAGEIVLAKNPGMTEDSVVISNLKYFGAPRNTGFVLMPNEVEAYRLGPKAFEFKGTNGFMITYDITSKDVPQKAA